MSNSYQKNPISDSSGVATLAFILVGTTGVGIFLCMPVIGPALVSGFNFSERQVGEFSFIQLAFVSLGCITGLFLSHRYSMRTITGLSLGLLLTMDISSPYIEAYSYFLTARAIAGVAGGVVMALATGALAQLPSAEKYFGLFLLAQIVFSVIGIWAIPQLVGEFSTAGAFYPLVIIEILVILFFVRRIPHEPFKVSARRRAENSPAAWFCSGVMLLAILAFFTAVGAYWTYIGLIGGRSGIPIEAVGRGLSVATIGGALGSLVPVVLQQRIGQLFPLIAAASVLLLSLFVTSAQSGWIEFTLGASMFTLGWYIFHPYQLSVLAGVDSDGRPAMASAALTGIGLGLGPAVVSRFIEKDFSIVYLVSGAGFLFALALIVGVILLAPRGMVTEHAADSGAK